MRAGTVISFPGVKPDPATTKPQVNFNRHELTLILDLYGRHVASGEWLDYALDFAADEAVFSIFRRHSEQPLYRIIKQPELARKQGAYAAVASGGLVLKRGNDLSTVLRVLIKSPKLAK